MVSGSVGDWMGVVARVRDDAERLVIGVARDVRGLAQTRVVSGFEQQLARLGGVMLRRLSAATQREIDELEKRVVDLEARLETIARARRTRRGAGGRPRSRRVAAEARSQ